MDGYKATQTIRQLSNKDKATIPIIALTANAFEEDRKKEFKDAVTLRHKDTDDTHNIDH